MKSILFFLAMTVFGSWNAQASSLVYVPERFSPPTAKVVVVIHGCMQTPESMALGTGWNQLADRHNLVVIYPQVPTGSNPIDCWTWYAPENQRPDSGQLRRVRDEIKSWTSLLRISKSPVFVTGISSGAATTAGLLACFPDEFAAGAIHSGPSYGLVDNLKDGERVLKEGPGQTETASRACNPADFKNPLMVVQGTADKVVNPANVKRIVSDYLGSATLAKTTAGEANGLKYTIATYVSGKQLRGSIVAVEGLGHAWAGYGENLRHSKVLGPAGAIPTTVPFFENKGPSSTNLIFEFFQASLKTIR